MIRAALIAGLLLALSACAPKPTTCNAPPNIFESFMPKKTEDRMTVAPKAEPKAAPKPKYTPRPKPSKPKKKKAKAKPNPWPCSRVRKKAGGLTFEQAKIVAFIRGTPIPPEHEAYVKSCLK